MKHRTQNTPTLSGITGTREGYTKCPPVGRQILSQYSKMQQNLFVVTAEKLENTNTSPLKLEVPVKIVGK
jgi:hypothetical protein